MIHFFSTLHARLLLIVLLATIPVIGLTFYSAIEERDQEAAGIQETALRLARLAASSQERLIESTHQLLIALSKIPAIRERDTESCSQLFAEILVHYPSYTTISAFDPEGNLFCSAVASEHSVNISDRPYFQRLIQNRDFVVGDYQVGRITGKPEVVLAYPIRDASDSLLSIIIAPLNLDMLGQSAAMASLPEGATISVLDRKGTVLARYPEIEGWIGRTLPDKSSVRTILERREGTMAGRGMDGAQRLYAFTPMGEKWEAGAFVRIGLLAESAYAGANRLLLRNLALIGLVTILALAAARFTSSALILRPIDLLMKAVKEVARGNLEARTGLPQGNGELNRLARAFDEMAGALQRLDEEKRRFERRLRQAQKSEAIGAMAGGIAHDFNNLLTSIIGYTDMAVNDTPKGDPLRENLEKALLAGYRAKDLVSRILAFSRMGAHRVRTPVFLSPLIEEALEELQASLPPRIKVRKHITDSRLSVLGDSEQLRQVLDGLLSNAAQAMKDAGGILSVSLAKVDFDADSALRYPELKPGSYVSLSVTDTGCGIEEAVQERIFDPYFTTKSPNEGSSGLGLAVVRGIAHQHGGEVFFVSSPGTGSSFHVLLPEIENGSDGSESCPSG